MIYQRTLRDTVSCTGVGVHSGVNATLTLKPGEINGGFVFVRTDITDKDNVILGRYDKVTETQLCTVLSNESGASISTVEHVLSALVACGVDNATIEIDGPEMPIMDGSAAHFVDMIENVGTKRQNAGKRFLKLNKTVTYTEGDMSVTLSPSYHPTWAMDIDFSAKSKVVGQQSYCFEGDLDAYKRKIARARTFGFLHEVEALQKMGLARGGSLDNAIVVDGDKILNPGGLRLENEFVRHKILDAIGDIALAGAPVLADYHGSKAGHAMNNKVLRAVFADQSNYEWVTSEDIQSILAVTSPIRVSYSAPSADAFALLG
jgi:UDP-3-O-[3-hydroxymyristoyl] N-acetylglucosamine deacetylase